MKSCNYHSASNGKENGIKEEHIGISVPDLRAYFRNVYFIIMLYILLYKLDIFFYMYKYYTF